jgi:hypothetical protein
MTAKDEKLVHTDLKQTQHLLVHNQNNWSHLLDQTISELNFKDNQPLDLEILTERTSMAKFDF